MAIIMVTDLPTELRTNELAALWVAGANAKAARVAPCLASDDPEPSADQLAEAQLILVGAVRRWAEAGAGALSQQQAGPFGMSVDTRQRTGYSLWPSEIEGLQTICQAGTAGKAFEVDTAPAGVGPGHWSAPDVWTPA